MTVPLHRRQGAVVHVEEETPEARKHLEAQLHDLRAELSHLRLKRMKQRLKIHNLRQEVEKWKQQEENQSQAIDAMLQTAKQQVRAKEQQHAVVKQEWEQTVNANELSRFLTIHRIHDSTRRKPLEERSRDSTRTRFYETHHQHYGGSGSAAHQQHPSPKQLQQAHSMEASLSVFLTSSSPHYAATRQSRQQPPRTATSIQSTKTATTSFASTSSLSRFLMGLQAESSFSTIKSTTSNKQSAPTQQRQCSLQGMARQLLDSLDTEKL